MSKSDTWENGLLDLLFDNVDFTLVGDAGGLRGSLADGSLYFSLHSADPGEAGDQTTSEAAYAGYARVAVSRTAGFTVTGSSVSPAAAVTFPPGTAGGETVTYFGVGTDSSGAGKLLYSGTVTPNIVTGDGVTPELTTATAITED
jgi:hypothetical protein